MLQLISLYGYIFQKIYKMGITFIKFLKGQPSYLQNQKFVNYRKITKNYLLVVIFIFGFTLAVKTM